MDFSVNWFSAVQLAVAAGVWLLLTALCVGRLWRQRPDAPLCVAALCLVCLSRLQAQVPLAGLPDFAYHLLGVHLACLMVGVRHAWILAGLVLAVSVPWMLVPVQALCTVLPACAVNVLIRRWTRRCLPANVFVYIFINGFLGAAAGMLLTGVTVLAVWHAVARLPAGGLTVFVLLAWGEAFLTGLLTAVLVAFAPRYLATFADAVYLRAPPKRIWKD